MDEHALLKFAEKWYGRLIEHGEMFTNFLLETDYDDTSRRGTIALNHMLEIIAAKPAGGIWLDGPEGYGKHTAAYIAVKILFESENSIESVFISGSDLQFAEQPAQTADACWQYLTDQYAETSGVCLVLDDMEQCDCSEAVLNSLGRFMCRYITRRYASDLPEENGDTEPPKNKNAGFSPVLLVILIDRSNVRVPFMMRQHLVHSTFTLPSKLMRYQYVRNYWERLGQDEAPDIPAETVAEQTEGCTFQQLVDAVEEIAARHRVTYYPDVTFGVPYTDIDTYEVPAKAGYLLDELQAIMLRNGIVMTDEADIFADIQQMQTEDRHALAESLLQLLDRLPNFMEDTLLELIRSIGTSRAVSVITRDDEVKTAAGTLDDLSAMDVRLPDEPNEAALRAEANKFTGRELALKINHPELLELLDAQ